MPKGRTSEPPRPGYRCDWDDGHDRLLVYCSRCTNWCIHGCPPNFAIGEITHRSAHCKVSRGHPSRCDDYFIVSSGEATPELVEWLSHKKDWPKTPADFDLKEAPNG